LISASEEKEKSRPGGQRLEEGGEDGWVEVVVVVVVGWGGGKSCSPGPVCVFAS